MTMNSRGKFAAWILLRILTYDFTATFLMKSWPWIHLLFHEQWILVWIRVYEEYSKINMNTGMSVQAILMPVQVQSGQGLSWHWPRIVIKPYCHWLEPPGWWSLTIRQSQCLRWKVNTVTVTRALGPPTFWVKFTGGQRLFPNSNHDGVLKREAFTGRSVWLNLQLTCGGGCSGYVILSLASGWPQSSGLSNVLLWACKSPGLACWNLPFGSH